jgi:hypothetical protein
VDLFSGSLYNTMKCEKHALPLAAVFDKKELD